GGVKARRKEEIAGDGKNIGGAEKKKEMGEEMKARLPPREDRGEYGRHDVGDRSGGRDEAALARGLQRHRRKRKGAHPGREPGRRAVAEHFVNEVARDVRAYRDGGDRGPRGARRHSCTSQPSARMSCTHSARFSTCRGA